MKVYKYDENGVFERDDLLFIEDDEKLPEGYTTIAPPVPSINPVFNIKTQEWSAGDDPSTLEPAEPSEIEQLKQENADTLLQIAEVEASSESVKQDQADLLMTLAEKGVI
ncbi:hypothetical protein HB912_07020 [Listeria aquatica]|uniref:Bacteriophage SP-beta YorD domain-containing protein n=1 Tax=Listeria aquatica TaxID=1494960 RepID=A0A841ZQD3_9LIST|nr:hypothetical protein [Listeria aquatica]MBC1521395.1 hypothetical protein [Listeria aquatica]